MSCIFEPGIFHTDMNPKGHILNIFWSYLLLSLVVFTIFLVPLFPLSWHGHLYGIFYSLVFLCVAITADRNRKSFLYFAILTTLLQWVSLVFNFSFLFGISAIANLMFFTLGVVSVIRQIAGANDVTERVILGSITGYLLVGLIFSMFVSLIMLFDPGAFNFPKINTNETLHISHLNEYIYFSFITLCTVGYGDVVPVEPYSRSLSVLISVAGQLYIAVVIALLVGKYAAGRRS